MIRKLGNLSNILKCALFVMLISGAASAASSPPMVTSYWGNVTFNSTLGSNLIISVSGADGVQVANTTSNQNGLYLILVPWDDSTTAADEGVVSGETISFKVSGVRAQTVIVGTQGTNNGLDLTATGGDIVSRYAGADGIVQRNEAIQAVVDYFNNIITKQEAIEVVLAYFGGS